jgi:hypothetical protein
MISRDPHGGSATSFCPRPAAQPADHRPSASAAKDLSSSLQTAAGRPAWHRRIVRRVAWMAYFRLAQRVSVLGKLDGWLRRRLR